MNRQTKPVLRKEEKRTPSSDEIRLSTTIQGTEHKRHKRHKKEFKLDVLLFFLCLLCSFLVLLVLRSRFVTTVPIFTLQATRVLKLRRCCRRTWPVRYPPCSAVSGAHSQAA